MLKNIFPYLTFIIYIVVSQQYRPYFHYTPRNNWMNDPNGQFYDFDTSTYNLYYQYNPYGSKWGHMSWGHATSTDLIKWTQHPVAILEQDGIMIFSGSALKLPNKNVVAFYTGMDTNRGNIQQQSLAFSHDNGMSFEKYKNNPIIDIGSINFRDPKVYWHQQLNMYIMAVVKSNEYVVQFYGANQVTDQWRLLSQFGNQGAVGGVWQCPDLFKLPLKDGHHKWVLIININPGGPNLGSGTQYFVGQFNEKAEFIKESGDQILWLDYGHDFYAASSWNQSSNGKKYLIAWANNWRYANDIPTKVWRGAMTLPRELSLQSRVKQDGGVQYKINSNIVSMFQKYRDSINEINLDEQSLVGINSQIKNALDGRGHICELDLKLRLQSFKLKVLSNKEGDKYVGISCSQFDNKIKCMIDRIKLGNCKFNSSFCDNIAQASIDYQQLNDVSVRVVVDVSVIEFYLTAIDSEGFQHQMTFVERAFIPDDEQIEDQNEVILEQGQDELIELKVIVLDTQIEQKFE